jgi:hypothetical protein
MPEIRLDAGDAAELAEMITFLAGWLSGSQKQALAASFAAHASHPAYTTARSAPTCTGSPSYSAKPTARNSSASRAACRHRKKTHREPRRRISLHARQSSRALPRAPPLPPHPLPPVPL